MSIVTPEQSGIPKDAAGISYEQYLARGDAEESRTEWVDGRVTTMAPVSDGHSDMTGFVAWLLTTFVEMRGLGKVRQEPFSMKTGQNLPGRSPDVFVVCKENAGRIKKTYLEGPADLVVEVISPESRSRDRGEKFYEYEQGGVPEYWLIDPDRAQAEFYQRGADGIYRVIAPTSDGIYHSTVIPGLWIDVQWLWARPTMLDVLKAWKLI